MQEEKMIREEIEVLRIKLNEKMLNSDARMPDPDTLKLSQKMDELLNRLTEITKLKI